MEVLQSMSSLHKAPWKGASVKICAMIIIMLSGYVQGFTILRNLEIFPNIVISEYLSFTISPMNMVVLLTCNVGE